MKRILIVDDEAQVLAVLRDLVRGMSELHAVETLANGAEALEAVRRQRPDLVILDINMPGLDGITLLRRVRAHDRTIPVIMVTGRNDEAAMTESLKHGAFAYVPKPFDVRHVENLVSLALQPGAARR